MGLCMLKCILHKHIISIHVSTCFTFKFVVFKDKESAPPPKEQPQPEVPSYIPVVGEAEPEMKYVGPTENTKKKSHQTQNATDDFHFEKYKKKLRM